MRMREMLPVLTTHDRLFVAGVSVAYIVVSMSLLLSWPLLWPDEAIFADTARNVLISGHPSTTLIDGMESGSYWQPPAWFYCMAPVIGFLGYDVVPLRLVSMLIGLFILWATLLLARQLGMSNWVSRCAFLLLAFNPNFVNYVKLVRMDGLCTLFTLLGLNAYVTFCRNRKTMPLAASGALFGLAILTHPLGVIGPASVGCHALVDRIRESRPNFRTFLWIVAPGVVAAAIWYLSAGNDADFWVQIRFQMERKSGQFPLSLISFVERYRSLPFFGLLIPAGLVSAWKRVHRAPSTLPLLLALGATISTIAVALSFVIPYHVYCLPFLSIACAGFLERYWRRDRPIRCVASAVMIAVLCNFAAYFLFFHYEFHGALRQETDYAAFTAKISEEIPQGATVCITGYPCAYWGLIRLNRGYRLFDETFLSDSLGIDLVNKAGWFVLVNGLSPEDDRSDVLMQLDIIRSYATRAGKTCVLKDFIGTPKRFAYTARIFRLQSARSGSDTTSQYSGNSSHSQ
jgi:Dolichyl-phosphate-mannose-protein mannosyltransferase